MRSPERWDIVVVGAGAAGIMAGWRAATLGARVLVIEKTARVGTKILISGGGKCNVAHDGPLEEVIRAFKPNEARFIRPACYRLPNTGIMEIMREGGIELYTRPNGRVFPVSMTAKDVVRVLADMLEQAGAALRLECPVTDILFDGKRVLGVRTSAGDVLATETILTVGGSSWPGTGTTGDGWPWAKTVGHKIVPVKACLAPIEMVVDRSMFSGIALRDIMLKARLDGKEVGRWTGDLLITHRGISGPAVLGISREVACCTAPKRAEIEVDLHPQESFEELTVRLSKYIDANRNRRISGFLGEPLTTRLIPEFLESVGLADDPICQVVDKKARNRLVACMKAWNLGPVRRVDLDKGECVTGGVALEEVDPKTMRSLKCDGLFLAGEILDIAGPVGGYNLQSAFATGYVAGEEAATAIKHHPSARG